VKKNNKLNLGLPKFIGYAVMIIAVLSMICTTYYGTKYWMDGYFKKPFVCKDKKYGKWHKKHKKMKHHERKSKKLEEY